MSRSILCELYRYRYKATKKPHRSKIIIWQVIRYDPKINEMSFDAVGCDEKHYRDSLPLCSKTRGEMCVAANGNIYPCLQGSGLLDTYDIKVGNIFNDSIHDLLQTGSNYFKLIDMRIKKRLQHNKECQTCKYWIKCIGGCPLLSFIETKGDILGKDKWKCIFFKQGYYDRYKQELNGYLKK